MYSTAVCLFFFFFFFCCSPSRSYTVLHFRFSQKKKKKDISPRCDLGRVSTPEASLPARHRNATSFYHLWCHYQSSSGRQHATQEAKRSKTPLLWRDSKDKATSKIMESPLASLRVCCCLRPKETRESRAAQFVCCGLRRLNMLRHPGRSCKNKCQGLGSVDSVHLLAVQPVRKDTRHKTGFPRHNVNSRWVIRATSRP